MRVGRGIFGVTALVAGASVAAAVAVSFAVAAETSGAEGPAPAQVSPGPSRPLVVCADPNNLPFSNRAGQGFEIASLRYSPGI